jgi:hypothetical protein
VTVQNLQANIRVGESLFLVRGDGAQLEVNGTTTAPSGTFYQTIEDDGTPLPQEPALNIVNGDLATTPGVSTDLTLHYQFWNDSDGELPQRRGVKPNSIQFDVTDDAGGDVTRFALHSPIPPTVLVAGLRAEYNVDPSFVGTSNGSESNPYTTIAAALAASVAALQLNVIVWLAPGSNCVENVVFPSTGGNYVIAARGYWGFAAPNATLITGNVTCDCSVFSRFALANLDVTGSITGAVSVVPTLPRLLLTSVQVAGSVTLTAPGGGSWRFFCDGGASDANSEGGFITGATSVVGAIQTASWAFVGAVSWTLTSVFLGTSLASNTLTNTSGANTVTFLECTFAAGTTLSAPAGSCVAAFDGPSASALAGFTLGANVTSKTVNANRSDVRTLANNLGATVLVTSPALAGLYEVTSSLELLVAGTAGTAQLNVIYTDMTGTLQTKAVGGGLLITAALGTEAAGSLVFHHNGASAISFSVTGVVTPGALSISSAVAVMRRD